MSKAAKLMEDSNLDASFIMFNIWTEAIKNFAEQGRECYFPRWQHWYNGALTGDSLMAMNNLDKLPK